MIFVRCHFPVFLFGLHFQMHHEWDVETGMKWHTIFNTAHDFERLEILSHILLHLNPHKFSYHFTVDLYLLEIFNENSIECWQFSNQFGVNVIINGFFDVISLKTQQFVDFFIENFTRNYSITCEDSNENTQFNRNELWIMTTFLK